MPDRRLSATGLGACWSRRRPAPWHRLAAPGHSCRWLFQGDNLDAAAVMDTLSSVGYPLVQSEVPVVPGKPGSRLDVVAWGPDSNGELVPQVAVEIKRRTDQTTLLAALRQLELARD